MITLVDVLRARERLAPHLTPTPLRRSPWLSAATRADVHLKVECTQITNAFKIRGAFNALLAIVERGGRPTTIVTASAGNHGRAIALVAEKLGLRAIIFTPQNAPEAKKRAIRLSGAVLHDESADYDNAERAARDFAVQHDALFVSPYNDDDVIAGAATIALEIIDVLSSFDVLVVPVGGGGLLSGVALVAKAAMPQARVIGVETAASMPFAVSMAKGAITTIDVRPSLADGLTGNLDPGTVTFDMVRSLTDHLEAVNEEEIAAAIRGLASQEQLIAEGAGAVAVAALLSRQAVRRGETVVALVTGANIDVRKLAAILASA